MSDSIDRQAAIDIVLQYCPDDDGACSKAGHDPREMLDEIEALPPAQPEPFGAIKHAGLKHPLSDEEIIPRLRQIQECVGGSYAIDRAIELLTAQPELCEDAVSRETLVNFIKNASVWVTYKKGDSEDEAEFAENIIKQTKQAIISMIELDLPPVTPKQRTGKWEVITRHEHYPSGKEYEVDRCPFCHRTDHNGDGEFCGYCGAKMEGET